MAGRQLGNRMSDNTPVVVKAYRTPFGKEDGVFSEVRPEDLSIPLIKIGRAHV